MYRRVADYLALLPEFKRLCRMDTPQERFWPEKDVGFISLQHLFDPKDRTSKLMRIDLGIDGVFNAVNATKAKKKGDKNREYRKYKFKITDYHAVDEPYIKYPSCSVCNCAIYFYNSSRNALMKGAQRFTRQECCNNVYVRSEVANDKGKWIFMKNPKLGGPNGERIEHP
jgi:hypothetical protein